MITLLSPAKSLDFESNFALGKTTQPLLGQKARQVMKVLATQSPEQLQKLQSISTNLAGQNFHRNQQWQFPAANQSRQAILAFTGDVYQGLEAASWTEEDMDFANKHLRILSGLYGWLKPSDAIMPYRLEMGTKLAVEKHENLYDFWAEPFAQQVAQEIGEKELVLNLASNEYFKVWQKAGLLNEVIKAEFKDKSKGKYKVISFYAKRARGLMARFVIQHRINNADALKEFNLGGYNFKPAESTNQQLVFVRD
jgi:cytoplasmic iron level regulating protein YaaA (DUF328/UPF0246 family)